MRRLGGGAIVNTSSVSAFVPSQAQAIYGASKSAVTLLTRSAAREAGKDGIRVNEVAPAVLMSDMVRGYFEGPGAVPLDSVVDRLALSHAGEPEDGAAAILFLCSEQARYITGASLPVDGGFLLYNAAAG
jgi:NAD(P)-dependent dehydrogenase (short-subunit alcohol dehydrogenase family)